MTRHADSDLPGYGLRVRGGGGAHSLTQYAIGGRTRPSSSASSAASIPGKAYNFGKDLLARVRLGRDPAAEEHARTRRNLGALLPRFLEQQKVKQKPRSYERTERHLMALQGVPPATVEVSIDVHSRPGRHCQTAGPVAASRTRASLSAPATWLRAGATSCQSVAFTNRRRGAAPASVCCPTMNSAHLARPRRWHSNEPSDHYPTILKLLLLTGARLGGCAGRRSISTTPPSRCRRRAPNQAPHLPLSEPALKILAAQPY